MLQLLNLISDAFCSKNSIIDNAFFSIFVQIDERHPYDFSIVLMVDFPHPIT
jgi:hypothetical protein